MKNRYSGNLTKLHVFNALLFGKSVELFNHKEWSILIFIRKNYGIYNETFKQLYDSISVWITGLKVILLSYIF